MIDLGSADSKLEVEDENSKLELDADLAQVNYRGNSYYDDMFDNTDY